MLCLISASDHFIKLMLMNTQSSRGASKTQQMHLNHGQQEKEGGTHVITHSLPLLSFPSLTTSTSPDYPPLLSAFILTVMNSFMTEQIWRFRGKNEKPTRAGTTSMVAEAAFLNIRSFPSQLMIFLFKWTQRSRKLEHIRPTIE